MLQKLLKGSSRLFAHGFTNCRVMSKLTIDNHAVHIKNDCLKLAVHTLLICFVKDNFFPLLLDQNLQGNGVFFQEYA